MKRVAQAQQAASRWSHAESGSVRRTASTVLGRARSNRLRAGVGGTPASVKGMTWYRPAVSRAANSSSQRSTPSCGPVGSTAPLWAMPSGVCSGNSVCMLSIQTFLLSMPVRLCGAGSEVWHQRPMRHCAGGKWGERLSLLGPSGGTACMKSCRLARERHASTIPLRTSTNSICGQRDTWCWTLAVQAPWVCQQRHRLRAADVY